MKTRKSAGWIKVAGEWYEEVAKVMIGTQVIWIKTRCGNEFHIDQIDIRG